MALAACNDENSNYLYENMNGSGNISEEDESVSNIDDPYANSPTPKSDKAFAELDALLEEYEEQRLANQDKIPVGMQNRVISPEYYLILMNMSDEIGRYNTKIIETNSDKGLSITEQNQRKIELCRDLLVYLNGINYIPVNDVESEIHDYTLKLIFGYENIANYRIKFYQGDSTYKNLIDDEIRSTLNEFDVWAQIMVKYELFLEE